MYHLLKGYYQYYQRGPTLPTRNVLILGLDNAGKSTLLEMIKSLYSTTLFQPENIHPTIGQNIGRVTVGDIEKLVFAFWDLGGQENLRKLWEEYYRESDALIFVVDATDKGRIEECKDTLGLYALEVDIDCRKDNIASGYRRYTCVNAGKQTRFTQLAQG
jgi:ADP-ribosylation factor related protein 1